MTIIRTVFACLLLALATLSSISLAQNRDKGSKPDHKAEEKAAKKRSQDEAIQAMRRGEILPLARILEIANRHVPGDVIEVEYKGGPKYEIKILTASGKVREVELDARTGALLTIKDD
ncbi:MAG: hypothetical protein EOP02_33630 [Proteobacteria bacterium]|nr:MAG: hypothetical protein EOP02_33630 [Pseudomonadota bacterium]